MTLPQIIINLQMNSISVTSFYKAFKLSIWHSLSNWIAIPWGVERTKLPIHPFNLFTSLSVWLLLGKVKSRINRVPSGKDVSVGINVPEADISLVTRSKTFFRENAVCQLSLQFQSWTDQKDQNYEMELRNKKRIPVRRKKATKGK